MTRFSFVVAALALVVAGCAGNGVEVRPVETVEVKVEVPVYIPCIPASELVTPPESLAASQRPERWQEREAVLAAKVKEYKDWSAWAWGQLEFCARVRAP